MKLGICIAALIGIALATPATAQSAKAWVQETPAAAAPRPVTVGTLAVAKYKGGSFWYPAMVLELKGNLVTLQYGGGIKESLPRTLVHPLAWKRGSAIECKSAAGTYVSMTITAMLADYGIDAVTDQGKPHRTSLRSCRMKVRTGA